jgi:hypothetical protein
VTGATSTCRRARASRLAYASLAAAALASLSVAAARAAIATKGLTMYAVAVRVQFVDFSDDRTRGATRNPFNADVDALQPKSAKKQKAGGPYPGDTATYTFRLYRDAHRTTSLGTADYSCTFAFNKQAFCTADFHLKGGTIFAAGPADFTSARFRLAVAGGTDTYLAAAGQVAAVPAGENTHRLSFTLLG